jgi:hypothetical protein
MLRGVLTAVTSSEKSRASKLHSPSLVKRSPTISRPASHVADDPRSICKHNKYLPFIPPFFLIWFKSFSQINKQNK